MVMYITFADKMGREKKTKKFGAMKRMISASDPRLKVIGSHPCLIPVLYLVGKHAASDLNWKEVIQHAASDLVWKEVDQPAALYLVWNDKIPLLLPP